MALHKFKYGTTETGYIIVSSARYKKINTSISQMDFVLQSTLTTFLLDDDVEFYNSTTTLKFKGKITKVIEDNTLFSIEVKDLGNELITERFSEVYRSQSPEAIIENIITTKSDLTYSSTVSTGLTLGKHVFRDDLQIDGISKMMELFKGAYSINKSGLFTLIKKSNVLNSNGIISGVDMLQGGWKDDANKKYTKIIVEGGNIQQRTTETLSGTGTVFNTTFIPKDLEISGLTQTTENIDGDYTVDEQNLEITFNGSQTNPVVSYTYESQVRVEIGEGRTLKLQKSYLESTSEALSLALSALQLYQDGIQTSKWLKTDGTDFEDYNIGENISVLDTNNNKSSNYEITSIEYVYPSKLYLTVGESEDGIFDWQKESQQRIQELEQKDQNSEFVTKFNYNNNKILIRVTSNLTKLQTVAKSDAWILDDVVNSQIDKTFKLDGGTITNLI